MLFVRAQIGICCVLFTSVLSATDSVDLDKPVAVVSITSMDEMLADVQFTANAMGMPQVSGAMAMAGPLLNGLDGTRPMGLLVYLDGEDPRGIAFLPVKEFEQSLEAIEKNIGPARDTGGGIKKFDLQEQVFFKHTGEWVFIGDSRHHLLKLPANPDQLLKGLPKQYDIAVQLRAANLPAEIQQEIRSQLKQFIDATKDGMQGDELAQLRLNQNLEQIVAMFEGLDVVTIGMAIDRTQDLTFTEMSLTAKPDSKLAEQLKSESGLKTKFAGILNQDAAITFQATGEIKEADRLQARDGLEVLREGIQKAINENNDAWQSEDEKESFQEIAEMGLKIVDQWIEEGSIDAAGAILLQPESMRLVLGAEITKGKSLEETFRKFIKLVEDKPQVPPVEFDVAKYEDTTFHAFAVPMSGQDDEARALFGDRLDVTLGISETRLYVAMGKDGTKLLKSVIDSSNELGARPAPPARMTIALLPVVRYLASVDSERQRLFKQLLIALEAGNAGDQVVASVGSIEHGVKYRLELQEGVLQLIGQIVKLTQEGEF